MDKAFGGQIGLATAVIALVAWNSWQYSRTAAGPVGKTRAEVTDGPITLTPETVAGHAQPNDCWVIIDGVVYDVTLYLALHPGGNSAISQYCGTDGSQGFASKGGKGLHSAFARAILSQLKVGTLGEIITVRAAKSTRASIQQGIANGTIPAGKGEDD